MNLSDRIDELLMQVEKPVRYVGGEFGSIEKDLSQVEVRYAFLFPDTYEVGMSPPGHEDIVSHHQQAPDAWCERVLLPWVDMEEQMRSHQIPLFSLESRTPISEFDLLGITLQYEMSFSNILNCLDLAGIALHADERTEGPFVICGGPCAFNPEPLAPLWICLCGRWGKIHPRHHRCIQGVEAFRPAQIGIPEDGRPDSRGVCAQPARGGL